MSDEVEAGCPPLALLIRATEGAMPPEEARPILAHLRTCTRCREELQESDAVTKAAAVCLDEEFGNDTLPRRTRFRQKLEAFSQSQQRLLAQIVRVVRLPGSRWLSAAAVGPLLLAGLMLFNTSMAVVQADALLERVVLESHARPSGLTQQIQVTVTPAASEAAPPAWSRRHGVKRPQRAPLDVPPFSVVREAVDGVVAVPAGSPAYAASVEPPPALKRLFELQPVDWQRPLSVESLRAWRRALTNKHDEIRNEGESLLVLRTTTTEGVLREASLFVQRDTYRVIRQMLVFEGIGRVEIAELAQWVHNSAPAAGSGARSDAGGGTAESGGAAADRAKLDRDRLDRSEIDARIALREAGLDLGGLVRVARAGDSVHVDGIAPTDTQRRDLEAQLSTLPGVRVALRLGTAREAATTADGGAASSGAAAPSTQPALSHWLAHTFPDGTAARARFVPELTRLVSQVGQRLTALQDLAERYQTEDIRALSSAARARLQLLLNLHYEGLNRDLLALDSRMAVLFGSTERCVQVTMAPADWPHRAVTGLTHARALDRQVQELLTHDDLPALDAAGNSNDHASRTFGALWDSVNAKPSSRNLIARGPSPST
jgi:hypothetical protein